MANVVSGANIVDACLSSGEVTIELVAMVGMLVAAVSRASGSTPRARICC